MLLASCRKDSVEMSSTPIALGEDIIVQKIQFVGNNTGYACGGRRNTTGAVFKTTDGGANWQKIYGHNGRSIYGIHFTDDTTGYACGDQLLLLKTTNGGLTWNEFVYPELPVERFIVPLMDIHFPLKQKGYVLGGDTYENGIVLRTANAGASWIYTGFNNELRSASFTDSSTGVVSGYGGMFRTNDGGLNYATLTIKGDFFISLHFTDAGTGYAAGHNGGIYRTTDGGQNWNQVFDGSKFLKKKMHFNAIRFSDSGNGLAVGNQGLVMKTTDGGNTWKQVREFSEENFLCIAFNNAGQVFIGGEAGTIFKLD